MVGVDNFIKQEKWMTYRNAIWNLNYKECGLRPEQWLSQFPAFLHYLETDGRTDYMTLRNDHPRFTSYHRLWTLYV